MKLTLKEIAKKFDCSVEDIAIVDEKLKPLGEYNRGETVMIGGREWIVFNHLPDGTTQLVTKEFWLKDVKFDEDSNDYSKSAIRDRLNTELYTELVSTVGKENIIKHTVDLTTLDGRKNFGCCEDFVSLPTFDFVRANIDVFDKYKDYVDDWGFLATAFSTEDTGYKYNVCCLLPVGCINYFNCNYRNGVRAFCIFKSSILVSCE